MNRAEEQNYAKVRSFLINGIKKSTYKSDDWYIDCRRALMHSSGLARVSKLILSSLDPSIDHICGVTTGAVPLISATLVQAFLQHRGLSGSFAKISRQKVGIFGQLYKPNKIALIEDVATYSPIIEEYIKTLQKFGPIEEVLILVEREPPVNQDFANFGIRVKKMFHLEDLVNQKNQLYKNSQDYQTS